MSDVVLRLPELCDAETQKVFRSFVANGRITTIPARRGKRRLLLDLVVRLFEPGRTYEESEVNLLLMALYDDYVTLRRCLVDEQLLERDHGRYWRIGGTFEV